MNYPSYSFQIAFRRAYLLLPALLAPLLQGCSGPSDTTSDETFAHESLGSRADALSLELTPTYDKFPGTPFVAEAGKSVAQYEGYSLMSSFFDSQVTLAGGAYLYSGGNLVQSFRLSDAKPGACATSTTKLAEAIRVTGSSVENSSYAASNVLDGQLGTRWSSAFSDDQWLMFQRPAGASGYLGKLVLNWEAAYAADYEVQLSGSQSTPASNEWQTVFHQTNGKGGVEQVLIPDNQYTWVRLKLNRRATSWGYSLHEVELHGATPGCGIPTAAGCTIDTFNVALSSGGPSGTGVAMTRDWVAITSDNLGAVNSCLEPSIFLAKKSESGALPFGPITQYRIPRSPALGSTQSLDIDGNTLVFSASGEVQVWELVGSTWARRWTAPYPGPTEGTKVASVAVSGDRIVIGYPLLSTPTVLIASRANGNWSVVGSISGTAGSKFGRAVDVDGARLVVGSESSGLAVYRWASSFAVLEMQDTTQSAESVAIRNNVVAAGRSSTDSAGTGDYAHWYESVNGSWVNRGMPPRKLGISFADSYFADDVDVGGNTLLVGSRNVEGATGGMLLYGFAPFATVQAEDFTSQSGTQLEATQDIGGGQNVGWIDAGDTLRYADLGEMPAGTYKIEYRVASQNGGGSLKLRRLSINSPTPIELGGVAVPSTGAWQSWTTVSHTFTTNGSSPTILEILATSGGWNLNWFRITQLN